MIGALIGLILIVGVFALIFAAMVQALGIRAAALVWGFAIVVTLIVVLGAFLVSSAAAAERGPCSEDRFDVRPRMGHELVSRKVRGLIRCAEGRWPVSGGSPKAIAVAECESGLWPWAHGNGNLGIFQQREPYWVGRARTFLERSWWTEHQWERILRVPQGAYLARANVLVSIRMAHRGGWGPWSCA